jgi:hypothetical protein
MDKLRVLHNHIGPAWMLVLGFLLMFAAYEGGRVLHTRPAPYHLWRQADCLSLTANYQSGRSFLEPEIHARIADNGFTGNSAGEFPLIYWAMGQVWKITGQSEFAYRLFGILLHFVATLAFFHTLRRLLQSDFWALCTALLLFTSPVIVYYSVGFLTDVPAFDLVLIGWYFVVRFAQEQRRRWWAWAMACFTLAALLKVSAGISLVAIMALVVLVTVTPGSFGKHRKLLPSAGFAWAMVFGALLAIIAWYWYAEDYNTRHNGRYTFNSIWPIWDMSPEEVDRAWTFGKQILVFQVFDTTVWIVLGVALLALILNVRRLPWPVALLNALLLVGVVAYTILWFHAVDSHDYYFINPMIMLLLLWSTFLWWLRRHHPIWFHSRWIKAGFTMLLLFNVAYAANNMQMRYTVFAPVDTKKVLPIYHEHELSFWSAIDYYGLRSALDMGPALDQLGIPPDALVIYLDDITINGSLYLMGRKGFTNYGHNWSDPATFERLLERGATHLMFAEDHWLEDPIVKPYLNKPVAQHAWVRIYDLRKVIESEERETVLAAGSRPHKGIAARIDTIACEGAEVLTWCFGNGEYPLEVDALPAYGETVLRTEVVVQGKFHMDGLLPDDESYLVLAENNVQGQISHVAKRLEEGAFEFRWMLLRHPYQVRNKLFLWNRSGKPFALQGLTVEVRRVLSSRGEATQP